MPIVASNQLTLFDFYDNKQLALNIRTSRPTVVVWDGESSYTPDYTLDPQDFIPEVSVLGESEILTTNIISCKWSVEDESGETTLTGNEPGYIFVPVGSGALRTLRLTKNPLVDKNFIRYNVTLVVKDEVTEENLTISGGVSLVRLTNGSDAVVLNLTNDHSSLPALHDGTVVSYTGATTTVQILKGIEDVSSKWTLRAEPDASLTGTFINNTYTVTGLTEDSAKVTFIANFQNIELRKDFTINKMKQGKPSPVYRLNKSESILIRDKDGNLNPSFVTFSSEAIEVSVLAAANPAYFVIYERGLKAMTIEEYTELSDKGLILEGREYILSDVEYPYIKRYQSLLAEHTKKYAPQSEIHSLLVELYKDENCTELLDSETVHVASDGLDNVLLNVWCPEGDKIRNQEGNVLIEANLFQGVSLKEPDSIQWYHMEPLAVGDSDTGVGWKKIIASNANGVTGYTTSKLTVPGGAVAGNETYKVVVKWKEYTLSSTATITDVSDPILCFLDGVNTFKNGKGTTSIRCRLMRDNEELDKNGTEYTYTWSLYDRNFKKLAFSQTGKTVTVSASSVESLANLTCDVHKI